MLYKVLKDGVTIDDVEFAKDELVELAADALNVSDLLADGLIEQSSEEDIEEEDDSDDEDTDDTDTSKPEGEEAAV